MFQRAHRGAQWAPLGPALTDAPSIRTSVGPASRSRFRRALCCQGHSATRRRASESLSGVAIVRDRPARTAPMSPKHRTMRDAGWPKAIVPTAVASISGAPVDLGVTHREGGRSDAGAAEVDQGDQRRGGVEAEAAVADQADRLLRPSRRPLLRPRRIAARIAVAVAAEGAGELDERSSRDGMPRSARRRGARARASVVEVVEQPELLRAAGTRGRAACWLSWTSPSLASWSMVCVGGGLEQRPAGALDPLAFAVWERRGRSTRRGGPGRPRVAAEAATWNGSKQISASGIAARMACW